MIANPYKVVFFDLGDTLVVSGGGFLPGAKATLATLHGLGVRLGIISNTGTLTRKQLMALLPSDFDLPLFEPALVLLSSEVHVEKPALGIFQLAVEKAAVNPSDCLFCTENLLDSLAAQRTGMHIARLQLPPHSEIGSLAQRMKDLSGLLG